MNDTRTTAPAWACRDCGGTSFRLAPKGFLRDGQRAFRKVCTACGPAAVPQRARNGSGSVYTKPIKDPEARWLEQFEAAMGGARA